MKTIKVKYADRYLNRLYDDTSDAELRELYTTSKAELVRRGLLKEAK